MRKGHNCTPVLTCLVIKSLTAKMVSAIEIILSERIDV